MLFSDKSQYAPNEQWFILNQGSGVFQLVFEAPQNFYSDLHSKGLPTILIEKSGPGLWRKLSIFADRKGIETDSWFIYPNKSNVSFRKVSHRNAYGNLKGLSHNCLFLWDSPNREGRAYLNMMRVLGYSTTEVRLKQRILTPTGEAAWKN